MNNRMILALVLSGVVLLGSFWLMSLFSPKPPAPTSADNGTKSVVPTVGTTGDNGTKPPPAKPGESVPTPNVAATVPPPAPSGPSLYLVADNAVAPVDNLVLAGPKFTTHWTNRWTGACTRLEFNKFYTTVKHAQEMTLVGGFETETASMALEFPELSRVLDNMTMRVARADAGEIVFTAKILKREPSGELRDFLQVTKTVRLSKDKYEVEAAVSLKNLTAAPLALKYDLRAIDGMRIEPGVAWEKYASEKEYAANATPRITLRSESGYPNVTKKSISDIEKLPWQEGSGNVWWAGIDDRYFAAAAWAEHEGNTLWLEQATVEEIKPKIGLNEIGIPVYVPTARVRLTNSIKALAPQGEDARTFHLFAGPKESDVLDSYAVMGFPKLVDYGIFGFIAIGIIWLLRGIYFLVRNYGVAILIMTGIIRVLLHPLTRKGQVAMAKMQRLKPKIQELQKKFKNDKQKLAQEQMKLFREAGVSPMSGCLPMLLQLPVLYALFTALRYAFEMRQSPFVGWMADLSQPDAVSLPFSMPLVGDHLNILPILMTAAMFIQQLMQPKAEDEQTRQQQKMMMFLPFLFMFMFYSFPAGLNLYWFSSTLIGIGEQWYIQRHINETLGPAGKTA